VLKVLIDSFFCSSGSFLRKIFRSPHEKAYFRMYSCHKKELRAGEVLDVIGEYRYRGSIERVDIANK